MRDPLAALGGDIFIDVLACLDAKALVRAEQVCRDWRDCTRAHSSFLWRLACLQEDIDSLDIKYCDSLALTGTWNAHEHDRRPVVTEVQRLLEVPPPRREFPFVSPAGSRRNSPWATPAVDGTRVNWRYVCKAYYDLQNAWATGRSRVRWITPPANAVWRIKSVPEDDVLLCTSRMNGFMAVDRRTSLPLFVIAGLDGYAHLEAGRGFAVFDRPGLVQPLAGFEFDEHASSALEVWRNNEARQRSTMPRSGTSHVEHSAFSHSHPDDYRSGDPNTPLPRGHYQHYRTLLPPTRCMAYRLHVDRADSDEPRAVLASAGSSAIYLWHLEDDTPMQKVERGWEDTGRPSYIELDDNYVFVCLDQMHVYSRKTLGHLCSFPPTSPIKDCAELGVSLSLTDDFKAIPDRERQRSVDGSTADGVPATIGRGISKCYFRGEPEFDYAVERGMAMHSPRVDTSRVEDIEYNFSAVHFTSHDLICTTRDGAVFIVRNYTEVFASAADLPEEDRSAHVARNTIIVGLGTMCRQLTTYRDHIVVCTSFNIILIDGRKLPPIPPEPRAPISDDKRPTLRAHVLLGNHPQAMKMSSCIQADARSIFLTYWATGEAEAAGAPNPANLTFPPAESLEGFGMCVKVWTFGSV